MSFQPRDKVKLVGQTENIWTLMAEMMGGGVENGDTFVVEDPPEAKVFDVEFVRCCTMSDGRTFLIRPHFLELVTEDVCRCDVWLTGCVCGAFSREQVKTRS